MDAEATITLPVSAKAAKSFEEASDAERERLISLIEDELHKTAVRRLMATMDEIGREAAANELTPDVLADILNTKSNDE